jgi:hypothetical protein
MNLKKYLNKKIQLKWLLRLPKSIVAAGRYGCGQREFLIISENLSMSFFEESVIDFLLEIVFSSLNFIGISIKWIGCLGKKPFSEIRTESWNSALGFVVLVFVFGIIISINNSFLK